MSVIKYPLPRNCVSTLPTLPETTQPLADTTGIGVWDISPVVKPPVEFNGLSAIF